MNYEESRALDALRDASQALQLASERCASAGYGSQVLVPLSDARREVIYAFDTATGRN